MSDLLLAAARRRKISTDLADAIDFDGDGDQLQRSGVLSGAANGKQFTFSAWIYNKTGVCEALCITKANGQPTGVTFSCRVITDALRFQARDSTGNTSVINWVDIVTIPRNTWVHVLASVDANTGLRGCYVNDIAVSVNAPVNAVINFAVPYAAVSGYLYDFAVPSTSANRLAHVYLDYTYRDLSIEANRRLFITADRKPAKGQADLNPILYLPLDDPEDPGFNAGTGGHFTLNGVVARSGRGPSQFNAPYSVLDGSADYLSRASAPTGIADGKQFTFSCSFVYDGGSNSQLIYASTTDLTGGRRFFILIDENNLDIDLYNAVGTRIVRGVIPISPNTFIIGRNYTLVISVDLNSTATRHVYANGEQLSVTWSPYTNQDIDWSCPYWAVGATVAGSSHFNGRLGNVFFDTKYIDLSIPANLAKFVTGTGIDAKPVDLGANGEKPFGTPPLIYLPMYGNNAGKNYGTGGDFTVNSGPFPGARGPNEYWGNVARLTGNTSYFSSSGLTGIANSKTFSFVCAYRATSETNSDGKTLFGLSGNGTGGWGLRIRIDSEGRPYVFAYAASGDTVASVSAATAAPETQWQHLFVFCDSGNNTAKVFINNQVYSGTVHANNEIALNGAVTISRSEVSYSPADELSELYFTTEYIDFSQEANRLKFRDAFGNPVDLRPQIEAGEIPEPAIYMRFDPANFGKNDGYGGDFTVNGTITDGGQL